MTDISRVIEEIREKAEKATPRPWWVDHEDESMAPEVPVLADRGDHGLFVANARGDETADYLTLAANHVLEIADAYEAAVADGAALRRAVGQALAELRDRGAPVQLRNDLHGLLKATSPGQQLLDERRELCLELEQRTAVLEGVNKNARRIMDERDRLREQLEAAQERIATLEGSMNPQDVAELFEAGGGE